MLFAVYGLDEVERIDRLDAEAAALRQAFLANYAVADPKALMREQRVLMARLRMGESRAPAPPSEDLLEEMLRFGEHLRKPVS